jgi:hypothetical protein
MSVGKRHFASALNDQVCLDWSLLSRYKAKDKVDDTK